MSSSPLLNWLAIAFSVFNTILLLWLGLTVLLNSQRRVLGVWLVGGSLVVGAAFFVSHTIILYRGVVYPDWQLRLWWKAGILPAHFLPYAWYSVMLWYAGYWQAAESPLRRRQRWWFWLVTGIMGVGVVLLLLIPAGPFPAGREGWFSLVAPGGPYARPFVIILAVGFSAYIVLCLALSLDVLRRPGPVSREMGELARRRARPWLVGATLAMLGVGLLVTWSLMWISRNLLEGSFFLWEPRTYEVLARYDLLILFLLTAAILLLGQAAVAYEIFTGQALPRSGLRRHWGRVVLLGSGYSLLAAGLLVFDLPQVHGLLLLTLVSTGFAALLGWRSYAERERTMSSLRPFVTGQRLYDQLLSETAVRAADLLPALEGLRGDVLGAKLAFLVPQGAVATLVDSPLAVPAGRPVPPLGDLPRRLAVASGGNLQLNPADFGGAVWAISLWNQRGMIGILLLGEKQGGALYTQEEIEVARAGGERLIDTLAGAEIATRLMELQRQRMVQSQLLDQQTRRILHDDVLPQLHTAMLSLSGGSGQEEAVGLLSDAHKRISNLLREMPAAAVEPVQRHGLLGGLRRLVEQEMHGAFERVTWEISPAAEAAGAALPPLTAEVVYHAAREAVRNAARHGRGEDGKTVPLNLVVKAEVTGGQLRLMIEDDGQGLPPQPGVGRTNGSGQGLTLHGTLMAVVGGELALESEPGSFTRVVLGVGERGTGNGGRGTGKQTPP